MLLKPLFDWSSLKDCDTSYLDLAERLDSVISSMMPDVQKQKNKNNFSDIETCLQDKKNFCDIEIQDKKMSVILK